VARWLTQREPSGGGRRCAPRATSRHTPTAQTHGPPPTRQAGDPSVEKYAVTTGAFGWRRVALFSAARFPQYARYVNISSTGGWVYSGFTNSTAWLHNPTPRPRPVTPRACLQDPAPLHPAQPPRRPVPHPCPFHCQA
jgi:hypothetical protein